MATHLAEVRPSQDAAFPALLERAKSEIEKALPKHLTVGADRKLTQCAD